MFRGAFKNCIRSCTKQAIYFVPQFVLLNNVVIIFFYVFVFHNSFLQGAWGSVSGWSGWSYPSGNPGPPLDAPQESSPRGLAPHSLHSLCCLSCLHASRSSRSSWRPHEMWIIALTWIYRRLVEVQCNYLHSSTTLNTLHAHASRSSGAWWRPCELGIIALIRIYQRLIEGQCICRHSSTGIFKIVYNIINIIWTMCISNYVLCVWNDE